MLGFTPLNELEHNRSTEFEPYYVNSPTMTAVSASTSRANSPPLNTKQSIERCTTFNLNDTMEFDDKTINEEYQHRNQASEYVHSFARRVHGWSWQAWPIAMGTGAVFVLMSNLHNAPEWVIYPGMSYQLYKVNNY